MVRHKTYAPKMNDLVTVKGNPAGCVVVFVRADKRIADVRTAAGPIIFYYGVPWSKPSYVGAVPKRFSRTVKWSFGHPPSQTTRSITNL